MGVDDSVTNKGYGAAWIEEGAIIQVYPQRGVVDWQATNSGRELYDLRLSTPYAHNKFGEGEQHYPDVGAKCVVCQPSDESAPFVLAFVMDVENVENEAGEIETSAKADEFKCGPGDYLHKGREGNFIYLQRGGLLRLGSGPGNSTTFCPVSNLLHHVAKRYKLSAFGGDIDWDIDGTTQDAVYRFTAKERATDLKASVLIRYGKLDDAPPPPSTTGPAQVLMQFSISPNGIPEEGTPSAEIFSMVVDKVGNSYQYAKGTVTTVINNDLNITVNQNKTETVTGDSMLNVAGGLTELITGNRNSTALSQAITALSSITLTAPICKYGGEGAAIPGINTLALITWLASHYHEAPKVPPTTAPALSGIVNTRHLYL